jgi:hypothetical protein
MIRAVTSHHLLRLTRDIALHRACVGYLLMLMIFSGWGFGEHLASDDMMSVALLNALWQRVWAGLLLPLTLLTPWLVMRHMTASSHDGRVRLIAQAGLTPQQAVVGNLLALHLYLLQLMFLSLPVMIFIYLFGALTIGELGRLYVLLSLWLLLVPLLTTSWRLFTANGLGALVGSYISILILGFSLRQCLHTTRLMPGFLLLLLADAGLGLVVLCLCHRDLSHLRA